MFFHIVKEELEDIWLMVGIFSHCLHNANISFLTSNPHDSLLTILVKDKKAKELKVELIIWKIKVKMNGNNFIETQD